MIFGNSALCKNPCLTESLIILTSPSIVRLATQVATVIIGQAIIVEVICLFVAKGNKSQLEDRNVNTKSTTAFHLLMKQTWTALSTKKASNLQIVLRSFQ